MIIHIYLNTGLHVHTMEHIPRAPLPELCTQMEPPAVIPESLPYAVFKDGHWELVAEIPTEILYV